MQLLLHSDCMVLQLDVDYALWDNLQKRVLWLDGQMYWTLFFPHIASAGNYLGCLLDPTSRGQWTFHYKGKGICKMLLIYYGLWVYQIILQWYFSKYLEKGYILFSITCLFLQCFSSFLIYLFFGWVDQMCPVTRVGSRRAYSVIFKIVPAFQVWITQVEVQG